ncbi:ABC transporter ATP-binding protein [Rhodococcus jostii]|uniref:ABC transporter ATP-binding protein n=1 Tax=Rhodococcus jostii TaxID=132919 RepID=UPI00363688BA
MSSAPAVVVNQVSKKFRIYHERNQSLKSAIMRRRRSVHEDFWALEDVTLEIPSGSTFALVGDNGSGKSTLLKCMAQILYPNTGSIRSHGRVAALLEVGSGFHPELSGRDNVYLNGSILGMTRKELDRKFEEIVDFSGVEEFIDQPVKNYSSGMYVRLGFSVAINVEPETLLVDEVLAVGDAGFQDKCAEKFAQFRREGRTVVVVSHSMPQLRAMSDHAAWLEHGHLKEVGAAPVVLEKYLDSTRSGIRTGSDGRVRWGSGEVMVNTVEVLDKDAQPFTDPIKTGAMVVLRLSYIARERIDHPVFGFSIEALDGTHLWESTTRDLVFPADNIEGHGVVELMIPAIPLAMGVFIVHSSITHSTTGHVFDHIREAARIHVAREHSSEVGGCITMGSAWNLSPENARRRR